MRPLPPILRSIATATTAAPPIYFSQYSQPSAAVLSALDISVYPGLLFIYELRGSNGSSSLIACWTTKDHFTRDGGRLSADINSTPSDNHGFVANPKFQREPFWRRLRLPTAVVTIAAVIGAIQVIGGTYNTLYVKPDIELKTTAIKHSVVEGQPFSQTVDILNHLPAAHRNITLDGALRDESGVEHRISIQPALIPHIAPGETQSATVTTTAPTPGKYQLVVQARASAGWLADEKEFYWSSGVSVWPELPVPQLAVGEVRNDVAFISGRLAIGPAAPHGLECALEIPNVAQLRFTDILQFPSIEGRPDWQSNETPGHEDALLSWQTGPMEGERSVDFSVALQRAATTDWNAVIQRAQLTCQYRGSKDEHF